ncbi:bifunctional glycosyltransferase/CDP-glycerol:glycerophosphate glycerophosphotransferase [Actinomadura opuntiae]|uniref:bifunctional glycosyltransferase/CDP-glycerol:glycerophosphate glycerophosphotransferase n=1 Tax=Actinomadura sp. OS1-43 TaxID=604315 RepID=UPI00255A8E2C|nr:CDP-glycerol glycerophosphotransferase family protein [Actinomadura sp. OS1-43]MDL4816242.1 CDP-glycerol glycerophosphotransferase family protein [Actinomadura sp. OS1-43]
MPPGPDVTVVVIAFNDAARLGRAVRSALGQSPPRAEVVIVDDASTDATPEVAARLAARDSGRVRAFTLPVNSGGCGRPRNIGLRHARGRYVMFLDSDDTLAPNACRNLVAAAEDTGADLVAGRCVRVLPDREHVWYPRLYRESAVYDGILENPGLLYDTLATNKCYRRAFLDRAGLRFADRLHYEDLLFSAQAYLAAERIAVIPHRVYNWLVDPRAATLSISNRRAELGNFADRLEIHRRIDAALHAHGADEVALHQHAKFINHDLLLYLREMRSRDPWHREAFAGLARPYLAGLDDAVFEAADKMPAIAALMIREGDIEAALAAADHAPKGGARPVLSIAPAERDGRIYWTGEHLGTASARRVLDVTGLGVHSAPLGDLVLGGRVTAMRRDGKALRLSGTVVNPLGRIPEDAELGARLEIRDRRRPRRAFRVPATVRRENGRIAWEAVFFPSHVIRPIGLVDQTWALWLRLTAGDTAVEVRLTSEGTAHCDLAVPVRPRLTRAAGDRLVAYVAATGELALRVEAGRWPARVTLAVLRRAARTGAGRRWWRRFARAERRLRERFTARRTKIAVFNRVLVRLPVRRGTVVFESRSGARYCGDPKYIYRALHDSGAACRAIWSYRDSRRGFPDEAFPVKRGSWAYYRALARAEFWIDDGSLPGELRKRPQTTYIQTRGSALNPTDLDGRCDHIVVRSEDDVRAAGGLGAAAEPLRTGCPRNDPLINGGDPHETAALRRRLGLSGDRRTVVLYAPAFRPRDDDRPAMPSEVPFPLERFARELGGSHVLLVRPHGPGTAVFPPGMDGAVIDAGAVHDVTLLMLLSDALVTDRAPLLSDYALLDRPMIFYTPDAARRTGLPAPAPGPVAADEDALLAALADLDGVRREHAAARRRFADLHGEYDTGTAAKAIVERFFTGGGR